MGSITAHILTGTSNHWHGGIIPMHQLYLSEGDQPCWSLVEHNPESSAHAPARILWTPTLESMLEDAIALFAVNGVRDETIRAVAQEHFRGKDLNRVGMYEDFTEDGRMALHKACRENIDHQCKLVISIFGDSSAAANISALSAYHMDIELCVPVYIRSTAGDNQIKECGKRSGSWRDTESCRSWLKH